MSIPQPDSPSDEIKSMPQRLDRALVDGDLVVRPFDDADRKALIDGRDDEFHRFLGEGSPTPEPVGCIWLGGTLIGWIDFDDERDWLAADEVNVGYNVFADYRSRGYGTRALTLLCEWLAGQSPPLRPTLLIDPHNTSSLGLARRAGFEHAGIVDGDHLHRPGQ